MKLLKKIICLTLAIAMLVCTMCAFAQDDEIVLISENPTNEEVQPVDEQPVEEQPVDVQPIMAVEFSDMDNSHFAYDAVTDLYKNGFISGDETGTIRPEDGITREETAKLALNINKVAVEQGLDVDFPDGDKIAEWAKDVVATAYKYGILRGDETGYIRPCDTVTRAEMVAIVIRSLNVQLADASVQFADVDENDWYAKDIAAASYLGLVNGYEDGTFKPDDTITRAEAFVVFSRVHTLRTALENAVQ